jgi:hypothetical protein
VMRALMVVLSLAGLGSCGQVPRPFEHRTELTSDLLVLKDRAGIVVAPLAGDLPADPERLASAMAKRLRDLNVPASTRAVNNESRYLHGWAARKSFAAAPDLLVVEWELWDLDGRLIGSYTQQRPLTRIAVPNGGAALINAMAAQAAPKIAALVQQEPVIEARIPGFPGARLFVVPLSSGPGDSPRSLVPALRAELAAAGLPVSKQQGPRDLLVLGKIVLEPAPDDREEIAITWSVAKAQGGGELGQIDQRNQVPAGSLDGPWGATAVEIARAAARGIAKLLDRAAIP